jgi:hypothetical protein
MDFFSYLYYKLFPRETNTTDEDEQIKEIEKMKKIEEQRFKLLPFAWKYKIACETKEELKNNLSKTKELSEKCEILHDSAKTYQQLTKQLSEKYK